MVAYTTHNVTNGQVMSIPKPGQIINGVDNYIQYKHPFNPQPIGYVKERQVGDMVGQQRDIIVADSDKLKNFELDMKVGETQKMDEILTKFTTLDSMPDMAFVMAEEFKAILNFCSGVFELRLSCDGNGPV